MTRLLDFLFDVLTAFQPGGPCISPVEAQYRSLLRRLVIGVSILIVWVAGTVAADTILSTLEGLSPGVRVPTLQVAREHCGTAIALIGLGIGVFFTHTGWALHRLASQTRG